MIKFLLPLFLLIFSRQAFSQTNSSTKSLESILGFNIVQATNSELESVGLNPSAGEGGVKVVDFGYRLTAGGGGMVAGEPLKIGDILVSIDVYGSWGKFIRSFPIINLKEFCRVLMEFKNNNAKVQIKASTSSKSAASKTRQYTIDISALNAVELYKYIEGLDKQEQVEDKPKESYVNILMLK